MKNLKLTATKLRVILLSSILIIIIIAVISFFVVQKNLYSFATKINTTENSSDPLSKTPKNIIKIKNEMSLIKDEIFKSSIIAVASKDYQTQAINDLKKYADDTGITINDDYSFNIPASLSVSTQLGIGDIQTQPVNITISNPVEYSSFIKFLKLVETNLPKMQITGLNISRVDDSKTQINIDPITVEVYTR